MKNVLLFLLLVFLISCSSKTTLDNSSASIGIHEGYVVFNFDIEKDGSPSNIKIVESVPKGVFDEEALKAIKLWKFKPKIVDGKAVKQFNMNYTLEFKLED